MTPPTVPSARPTARDLAAAVLARYPASLPPAELLPRVCRDERIEVLDADLRDVRGVLRREGGRWRAYLSRQDAPARRLLTLAHLLGHYFLHAGNGASFVVGGLTGYDVLR